MISYASNKAYKKTEFVKRIQALKDEYSNWKAAHRDLSKYINPTRGSFDAVPSQRGKMIDHQTLLDDHATKAAQVLAAGMYAGMTSPSRPWIKLTLDDPNIAKRPDIKQWLEEVADRMHSICNNSNIYDVFKSDYEELGQFGTACCIVLEDYDTVIRARNFTAGEYWLGMDDRGIINSFGREYSMQIGQLVKAFGLENCSAQVQAKYNLNKVDEWVKVSHLIEPNDTKVGDMAGFNNMPFRSAYWETGGDADKFLAIKGFEEFPVLAPRWDTTTTYQIYGYGPGWFALGDIKQLQKTTEDKLLLQEKLHNPPVQADSSVGQDAFINLVPGGVTRTSANTPNAGVRPAYEVQPRLDSFVEAVDVLHQRIDRDFYVNLFMMLISQPDDKERTAKEIAEFQEEKVMMLAPVLEGLRKTLLDPFVERLFGIMYRNMLIPPPPPEIEGMRIKVVYVSILAQAMRAIGINSINRIIAFVANATALKPDAGDNVDVDEAVREVADMEGVPAKLILEKKVVQQIREQRAKAAAMAQNIEAANSMADTAKKLSDAKPEGSVLEGLKQGMKK